MAWKYHFKYEKSMTLRSSQITFKNEEQFELSNSSILNLSPSNEDYSVMKQEDLEIIEQPKSFREEYGEEIIQKRERKKIEHEHTNSQ